MKELLTTKGIWFDLINSGVKKFDFRKGNKDISEGDVVCFKEADKNGNLTGNECFGKVNLVIHSSDFPLHFGWNGGEFTIIQFELLKVIE